MANVPYRDKAQELKRLKKCIENSFEYDRDNFDRFNAMRRFVFITSMDENDEAVNKTLDRPCIEFPILSSYISRLRGEFSKNIPAVMVSGKDGRQVDAQLIRVIEDHMRYILWEANKSGFEYDIYTDTLSGGLSAATVLIQYTGEMSFNQDIIVKRTFDPTMTFFDPMAREADKSDGRYSGECYPLYWEEFERQFPGRNKDAFKFTSSVGNFQWSYKAQDEDVIVVADIYEKKIKRVKIVMLTDGTTKTMKDYDQFLKEWELEGRIEQAPQIIGEPRMTEITSIVRYRICETELLAYETTDYDSLPQVYFDGDSILTKETNNSSVCKFTRPIVMQAKGAQKLKNFAGQALANELENMVQHKWIAALEGIPEEYKEAYVNPQVAQTVIYNAFKDGDQNVPLPPPQVVMRPPIPQEIISTFQGMDSTVQNILGTFDPSLSKLGEREVSGIAIQESLSLSNASSMPYVVSFLRGLQGVVNRILELIPKIYVTPRSIPVMTADGKRSYVLINQEGGIRLDYDKNMLQVKVEAGPSFGQQQHKALQQIIQLMQVNQGFAAFMNEQGLGELFDNMEFRGIDQLKQKAEQWMAQMQQMKQQQAQQPNPEQVKSQIEQQKLQMQQQEMQMKQQQVQAENQIKMLQMQLEVEKLEIQKAEILASIENQQSNAMVQLEKSHTERISKAAEIMIKKQALDEKKEKVKEDAD